MRDHLKIGTAFEDTIRIYVTLATETVETARQIQQTWPTATAAFGRVLIGTVLMGVMNDSLQRLTVQISGNGPLGTMMAVSNQRGVVKGYLDNPQVDLDLNQLGKLDVAAAVGTGNFTVIKDLGLREPYHGVVPIQSGEIAEDFAYYFTKSEQTPSAVALGVLVHPDGKVKVAGGLIVQLMPGASVQTAQIIETRLNSMPAITKLLDAGLTPSQLVTDLLGETVKIKFLEELPIGYACDCSWERFRGPLLSLGAKELDDLLLSQERIEVQCQFCNKFYHYDRGELGRG